ncbi:hypothetical protein TIFTF001_005430 [Ficus carica]|uniref:C-JID domain-containing protein n=1 Tax=Ficus carica TaxID=3494 RepID=A0AA88CZD9_FICCA|nr:hypothetical protein TIFTF001_005430 [Ficus carica]
MDARSIARNGMGKCSRKIQKAWKTQQGTEAIEKIILDMDEMVEEIHLSAMVFLDMCNLRLLKVKSFCDTNKCKVYFPEGLRSLPRALRYLEWPAFPADSLPSKSMLRNLVELKMPNSQLEQLWDGSIVQPLEKLTHIDLSHSKNLIQFPNLSGAPNLEIINLEHCTSLLEVPSNHLQNVDKLIDFNLSHCTSLSGLPDTIVAGALKVFKLSGCSRLTGIPHIIGTTMEELYLDSTSIMEVPSSIASHSHLSLLSVRNCECLESLPSSIHNLEFIESLSLFGCSVLQNIPELPKNMKELVLNGAAIKEIPSSIESLLHLESITLSHCQMLESLPSSIFKLRNLTDLSLSNCSNLTNFPEILEPIENVRLLRLNGTGIKQLPSSIHNLIRLSHLDLSWCRSLEGLPRNMCIMHSLRILDLSNCSKLNHLPSLAGLTSLENLDLSATSITGIPPSIRRLSKLQVLCIRDCKNLQCLTELPLFLEYLNASECPLLEKLILGLKASCDDNFFSEESVVSFLFDGCLKLDSNNIMLNFGYRVLRKVLRYKPGIYLGYVPSVNSSWPGSEVPEWFNYQCEGSSIKIKLPPNWNNTDFLGFVVCAVALGDYYPHPDCLCLSSHFHLLKTNHSETMPFLWRFKGGSDDDDVPTFTSPYIFTWFQYQMYNQDAEEASFKFFFKEWIDDINVQSSKTKVIRCGIRMLYRQDAEEFGIRPYKIYPIAPPTNTISKPDQVQVEEEE